MAVTSMSGFESRALAAEEFVNGANPIGVVSISTTQARTGAASLRCNPASGSSGYIQPGNLSGWLHFGLYIASLPSVTRTIVNTTPSASTVLLSLTSTGGIVCNVANSVIGTTADLSTNQWHWIGVRMTTGTSVEWLQIDGVNQGFVASCTGPTLQNFGVTGTESSAIDLYFDDMIIDNAGFLQSSRVDNALPIGCTAGGATDGNGGTTNIWEGVNNTPPAGVASANEAANPNANIRFPASTVVTFVATLESYETLGIGPSDEVLAVQSIIRHGEDIATGTKNGTLGAVSNPTISDSIAFTFGNDAGAHGAEAGLWATLTGTMTVSPSVTIATSPTLTISRASESRVGCVDYASLLVAWTPAPAAAVNIPYTTPYPQLLAH